MPQLDRALVKERAARLRAKGDAAFAAPSRRRAAARIRRVLVENGGVGRTEHFTPAEIAAGTPGDIVAARITGRTARALVATPLAEAACMAGARVFSAACSAATTRRRSAAEPTPAPRRSLVRSA